MKDNNVLNKKMYIKPDLNMTLEEAAKILDEMNEIIQEKDQIIIQTIKSGKANNETKNKLLNFHNALSKLVDCLDNNEGDDIRKLYTLKTDFNEILNDVKKAKNEEDINKIIEKINRILHFLDAQLENLANKDEELDR